MRIEAQITENKKGRLDIILHLDRDQRAEFAVIEGKLPKRIVGRIEIQDSWFNAQHKNFVKSKKYKK